MQFDKFTLKSQEAIQAAQQLAQKCSNQEIHPCHLARAILEQPDGVVVPVLQKIGITPSLILMEFNRLIDQIPKVSGGGAGQIYASAELSRVLDNSLAAANQMQDDFVSQEHLFLAIIRDTNNPSSKMLHGKGINEKNFLQALSEIREIGRASCRERVSCDV
jgi:ATP-dependent Clp protease ATP-binding subunit ClpB